MDITPVTVGPDPVPIRQDVPPADAGLRHVAREFEVAFLAEMLKHTGLGRMPEAFNGGAGEAAFSDLLTREYAEDIARTGRLGLAEMVYRSLRGTAS